MGEVWNSVDGDQVIWALQVPDDLRALVGGCIASGSAYSAHAEVLRFMPGSAVADRTRGHAARRPVMGAQAVAPDGGDAQAAKALKCLDKSLPTYIVGRPGSSRTEQPQAEPGQ